MKFVECTVCEQRFVSASQLLAHVKLNHRSDFRFSMKCSLCGAITKSYSSYYRHFKRKHSLVHITHGNIFSGENITEDNIYAENDINEIDLQYETAKAILCLKEQNLLTENSTNRVVEQMQNIIELHMEKVKERLVELAVPMENMSNILACGGAFDGLETQAQRERTFSSMFGLMKPQAVVLGTSLQWIKKKGVPVLKEIRAQGYIIPFLESLKRLFLHKEFQKVFAPPLNVSNDVFRDITDGSFCRSHPVLSNNNSLAIVAYYDDIEVANPLGPHAKTHKLAVFYWYVANIEAAYRSQLSSINLLAVAKTKFIRRHGVSSLLKDFCDGLNILSEGYSINLNGEIISIKGALIAFPSDTLASNYIAGFKESPSFSFSPCRQCKVKKINLNTTFSENDVSLRDPLDHAEQVSVVCNNDLTAPARTYWSKMFGIVGKSVFADMPYFDVTKCFVLDIMHVLFEGVLLLEIKLLLHHCLEQKYLPSIGIVNQKLKTFAFIGAPVSDSPSELDIAIIKDSKRKIKQNAAQSWNLALMLPFLIGQYIPDSDEHYENYIILLQILMICVAFEISREDVNTLQHLIHIHLATFVKLYEGRFVTPKLHYLIHLPRQILMFGPPRYLWCFRLEAKHRRLKQSAVVSQNFKNVSLTVAKRLEGLACLEVSQKSGFLIKKPETSKCSQVLEQSLPCYVNLILNAHSKIFEANGATFKNIQYKIGFYLLHKITDNFPSFMLIRHIYQVDNEIYFVCQIHDTDRYVKKCNSYVINKTNIFLTLRSSTLTHPHPVYAVVFNKEVHIVVRHYCCIEFDYLSP